uniref:Retinol dehydrogenase 14-like n=1 Tax=Phallusia mammillata TaxID=59560 RepID=A0A6F9DQW9_9ASCI|nr:retinol dehydrogenase 14-like [Phallusia mammillata]
MSKLPKPVSAEGSWVKCDVKLPGKTVIITGANTGIGFWTAVDLVKRDAKVIIACRNAEKAQEAKDKIIEEAKCPDEKVVVKSLDLSSFASIRQFAEDINNTEERLDILINNAGVMLCPEGKTEDGFETQFGVNHLGHFLLTNLLLDLIKKSAPSRIVVLSSIAHKYGKMNFDDLNSTKKYDSWAAYGQSKLANILFSRYLAKQLAGTRVTVNSVHPGSVKTELQRHIHAPTGSYLFKFVVNLTQLPGFSWLMKWKTAEHGAQTSIYCAVAPELADVSGRYFSDCKVDNETTAAQNDADAEKLWNVSIELTKLNA